MTLGTDNLSVAQPEVKETTTEVPESTRPTVQLRTSRSASTTATLPTLPQTDRSETRLPPLGDHARDDLMSRGELTGLLDGMAASLAEVDPRSSTRLRDLGHSIDTEPGRMRWGDVDLRRAFNTERLAHSYAVRREGGYAPKSIESADRVRNVLVLVPILLFWAALAEAALAYRRLLESQPNMVDRPFLLLWQQGFGGEASAFAPSFSTVALIDAVIILVILVLTFYGHGRREKQEDLIDATAATFQTDLDNVLAEASVALATDRASRPALLANSVERLADRFDQGSHQLLSRLQVEHDRLETMASRREKEFEDFGVFASGMRAGAEQTHQLLVDLRQVSSGLQTALEDLASEVGMAGEQQRTLLTAVGSLERLTSSAIQSDQSVSRGLTNAANNLAEAADKALTGAETAAQAGRIAAEAVRGIAELTTTLALSQAKVENAVANEAEANARLADALRGGTSGIAASTNSLNEIGAGLALLRGEFGRIANQTTEQSTVLSSLLEEQTNVATGLSQVARDLGAVGIATAQRQREVNDDLAVLLNRLDGVTNLLARAIAATPTTETIQKAFTTALRNELSGQVDMIADTLSERVGAGANAADNRGMWPRPPRR